MPAADGRDTEIAALETVIQALEPLDDAARGRVLEYALRRLGMSELPPLDVQPSDPLPEGPGHLASGVGSAVVDIRTLRTEKNPTSANEMAAVAAYYLAELAPSSDHKSTVTTADMERLFKQAGHALPNRIDMTLANAAAAGYFDKAGQGAYKLNPVGFNLVTQSLPRASAPARASTRKASRKKVTGSTRRKRATGSRSPSSKKATSTRKSKK